MTTGRFLSKTITTDKALNRLSWQAKAVYMMTIPHLDRDRLILGEPLLLMAQVAPLCASDLVNIMADLIQEWVAADLVVLYHDPDSDQPVLFFKNQELISRYARETPSMFAPPPGYERTAKGLIRVDDALTGLAPAAAPVTPADPGIIADSSDNDAGKDVTKQRNADSDAGKDVTKQRNADNDSGADVTKQRNGDNDSGADVTKQRNADNDSGADVTKQRNGDSDAANAPPTRARVARASAASAAQRSNGRESKNQDSSVKNSSSSTSSRARGQPDPRSSGLGKALPGTSSRTRVQPDPRASPAAKGTVKPDVYQALREFGVAEPALSELSRNGVDRAMVDGWIAYLATQDMARPVGYLVKRLRAHEQPPPVPEEEDPDSYEALKRKYVPRGWENVVIS
ncbi:MAG: hypothetical protein WA040_19925 [Anaerolineae bacterium]